MNFSTTPAAPVPVAPAYKPIDPNNTTPAHGVILSGKEAETFILQEIEKMKQQRKENYKKELEWMHGEHTPPVDFEVYETADDMLLFIFDANRDIQYAVKRSEYASEVLKTGDEFAILCDSLLVETFEEQCLFGNCINRPIPCITGEDAKRLYETVTSDKLIMNNQGLIGENISKKAQELFQDNDWYFVKNGAFSYSYVVVTALSLSRALIMYERVWGRKRICGDYFPKDLIETFHASEWKEGYERYFGDFPFPLGPQERITSKYLMSKFGVKW